VVGTSWHGVFEPDEFRRAFLRWVATVRGRDWVPGANDFAAVREATFETLADTVERYLDVSAVSEIIARGAVPLRVAGG